MVEEKNIFSRIFYIGKTRITFEFRWGFDTLGIGIGFIINLLAYMEFAITLLNFQLLISAWKE